jgi:hypothetical protein
VKPTDLTRRRERHAGGNKRGAETLIARDCLVGIDRPHVDPVAFRSVEVEDQVRGAAQGRARAAVPMSSVEPKTNLSAPGPPLRTSPCSAVIPRP